MQAKLPDWSEISPDLTYDAMKKIQLRTEWMKYRAKALDLGDEGIRSVRRDIRTALAKVADNGHPLTELLNVTLTEIRSAAAKHLSPCPDERLIIMIFYEVFQYGEAGELQNPDQKPSGQAS
ncbi:hypothetical protein [Acetobacter syzygii]|uniref:hypothetical protein n=1 Tax=Acetobacter syzygii TaxID=146476 RepID=UPI00156F886B|nr:hypothetical protein [Acetobacter syzygii]NSL91762.1 hypothetical protein [Acetobacter syzygii]